MDFIKANAVCDAVRSMDVETAIPTICMCCDIVAAKSGVHVRDFVANIFEMTSMCADMCGEYEE